MALICQALQACHLPQPPSCLTPPEPATLSPCQGNATTNGPPIVYLVPGGNAAESSTLPMLDPPSSGTNRECWPPLCAPAWLCVPLAAWHSLPRMHAR